MRKGSTLATAKARSATAKRGKQGRQAKTAAVHATFAEIGERIRHVRVELNDLDQRSFAERLGVTSSAVAQWELGSGASFAKLDQIVEEFGVSRDWLYAGKGSAFVSAVYDDLRLLTPERFEAVRNIVSSFKRDQAAESVEKQGQTSRGQRTREARTK